MIISWRALKTLMTQRSIGLHGTEDDENYYLQVIDSGVHYSCILPKNNRNPDFTDFETNYKPSWNQKIEVAIGPLPAFASKKVGKHKLFKRVMGIRQAIVIGENTITWENPYAWAKFVGVEVIGGVAGDYASLSILDSATGLLSSVPNSLLSQFGFTVNIAKDMYEHRSDFDADLYLGLQIKIVYNSVTAKSLGVNFILNELKL